MRLQNYLTDAINKKQLKFIEKKVKSQDWQTDIIKLMARETYFDLEVRDDNKLEYSTRRNGNVADERPGKEDLKEANRLLRLLRSKFKKVAKITGDTIDEWVFIYIDKK